MAMWGGRFSENTSKDVADYSESISFDKRLYKYDIQGSKAHATMLGGAGIIPEATAKMICEATVYNAKNCYGTLTCKIVCRK